MNPFCESHQRLAALAEIASDDRMTQRSLAAVLEVSLGLANALLRELAREGLVRVNAEGGSEAPRYAITRAGRGAMGRLARAFAAETAALLKKSLGRKAPAARRLSARRPGGSPLFEPEPQGRRQHGPERRRRGLRAERRNRKNNDDTGR